MSGRDPADVLKQRLAALQARLSAEMAVALRQIGDDTLAEAGRRLAAGGDSVSRPGEPPHDRAGTLAASLTVALDPDAASVRITSTSPQAAFLEYGTRTMAARPFLRPAIEAVRPAALAACRAALARATRGEGRGT